MDFLKFTIITLIFTLVLAEECSEEDNYNFHLGSKTPYRIVANTEHKEIQHEAINGCSPHKIWMVVRHGTRNPSAKFIEQMNERLPEIRDIILENNSEPSKILRNSNLYAFKKWKSKLQASEEKKLTHEGEDEMLELAERMQIRFPSLLPNVYSNTSYFIKYTATQRTKASAKYFAAGLFGRATVKDVWFPKPVKHDPTLRFYKLCNRWQTEVKNNPNSIAEKRKFDNSLHMKNIVSSINNALNLDNELSSDDIHLMYLTCAFETAWSKKKKSPWCSVFSTETVRGLEFGEDLKYYYRDGYGYEVTYKQACAMLVDVMSYFDSKSEYPKATIYFTHSGTILKLLAHLGLYKDKEHLKHTHYGNDMRKWKVSKIDAFGSNIAFILYKCDSNYKVGVLHQEKLVKLPHGEEFCDLSRFKEYYKESINECIFEKICGI